MTAALDDAPVPVLVAVALADPVTVAEADAEAVPEADPDPELELPLVLLEREVVVEDGLSVVRSLSENVDVSECVTETGGAVVTTIVSLAIAVPSTFSGLKIVMAPPQLETSLLS